MAELRSNEVLSRIKPSSLLLHHPASNNLSRSQITLDRTINVTLVSRFQGNGKYRYSGSSYLYWSEGLLMSIKAYSYKVVGGHSGANIEYSSEPSISIISNSIYVAFIGPETELAGGDVAITVKVTFSYTPHKSTFSGKIISGDFSKYCCHKIYFYNDRYGVLNCDSLTLNPLSDLSEWVLYNEGKSYFVTLSMDWKNNIWSILFNDEFNGSDSTPSKNCLFQSAQTEFYLELVSYYTI